MTIFDSVKGIAGRRAPEHTVRERSSALLSEFDRQALTITGCLDVASVTVFENDKAVAARA